MSSEGGFEWIFQVRGEGLRHDSVRGLRVHWLWNRKCRNPEHGRCSLPTTTLAVTFTHPCRSHGKSVFCPCFKYPFVDRSRVRECQLLILNLSINTHLRSLYKPQKYFPELYLQLCTGRLIFMIIQSSSNIN